MNPALFALGLALLAATALAVASALRLRSLLGFALAAYVLAVAEVVVLSQLLSLGRAVSREGYLVGAGRPPRCGGLGLEPGGTSAAAAPAVARADARRHPIVAALAVVVALSVLYALAIGVVTPPNNSDSMTYRLARAAAWLEHGGLHWIEDAAHRATERVPAELRVRAPVHARSARRRRGRRAAAARCARSRSWSPSPGAPDGSATGVRPRLFAGLLTATLAEVALQSTSTQNDLVTASLVAAAAYFVRSTRAAELCLAGASTGLALGTKLTAWVVPPRARAARGRLAPAAADRPRRCGASRPAPCSSRARPSRSTSTHTGSALGRAEEQDIYRSTLTARGAVSTGARIVYRFVDFTGFPIAPSARETVEDAGERSVRDPRDRAQPTGVRSGSPFTFVAQPACARGPFVLRAARVPARAPALARLRRGVAAATDERGTRRARARASRCRCWRSRSRSASPTRGAT